MTMHPGMLLFGLFDSGVAFMLVYTVVKAKLGGSKSALARIAGSLLGILVFIAYFSAIVWFNTEPVTVPDIAKAVVYAAPLVLSVLMFILVLLSLPPKSQAAEEDGDTAGQAEQTDQ